MFSIYNYYIYLQQRNEYNIYMYKKKTEKKKKTDVVIEMSNYKKIIKK
jgi:hypothetical protein